MDAATTTVAAAAATASATGNPYGLIPLWMNGNIVSRGTLVVLIDVYKRQPMPFARQTLSSPTCSSIWPP